MLGSLEADSSVTGFLLLNARSSNTESLEAVQLVSLAVLGVEIETLEALSDARKHPSKQKLNHWHCWLSCFKASAPITLCRASFVAVAATIGAAKAPSHSSGSRDVSRLLLSRN